MAFEIKVLLQSGNYYDDRDDKDDIVSYLYDKRVYCEVKELENGEN